MGIRSLDEMLSGLAAETKLLTEPELRSVFRKVSEFLLSNVYQTKYLGSWNFGRGEQRPYSFCSGRRGWRYSWPVLWLTPTVSSGRTFAENQLYIHGDLDFASAAFLLPFRNTCHLMCIALLRCFCIYFTVCILFYEYLLIIIIYIYCIYSFPSGGLCRSGMQFGRDIYIPDSFEG